jgi:hypothetical protein
LRRVSEETRLLIFTAQIFEVLPETVVVDFKWKTYPMGKDPAFYGVGSGVYAKRKNVWVEVLEHETVTKVDEELKTGGK